MSLDRSSTNSIYLSSLTKTHFKDSIVDITAGTIAGLISKLIEYPFDTIKTRLQTSNIYNGPMHCFNIIQKNEGISSLFRGITAPLIGSMFENALMFYSYNEARRYCSAYYYKTGQLREDLPIKYIFLSGAFSGLIVASCTTPIELIKCRMQISPSDNIVFKSSLDCLAYTVKTDGIKGLWRGHVSTLMRECPGNAIYFALYEIIVRNLSLNFNCERSKLEPKHLMLAGSLSGMAYWLPMFPTDLIKSRIQTEISTSKANFTDLLFHILKNEGVKGLYKGLGITLIRSIPSNACIFYFYESSIRLMNSHDY